MEEALGWYINNGPWAIPHLKGEGAICLKRGNHYDLQFHNRELPTCYTHGWRTFHENEVLLLRGIEDGFVFLEFRGKHYRRSIRNGKFQFHNMEMKSVIYTE